VDSCVAQPPFPCPCLLQREAEGIAEKELQIKSAYSSQRTVFA